MSDLISRQAAIDVVSDCGICMQQILDLPSAQTEIIRCRDCKYYKKGSDDVSYCCKHDDDILWQDDDYCSRGERRTE